MTGGCGEPRFGEAVAKPCPIRNGLAGSLAEAVEEGVRRVRRGLCNVEHVTWREVGVGGNMRAFDAVQKPRCDESVMVKAWHVSSLSVDLYRLIVSTEASWATTV
jgi:hypothetical protein